MALIRFLSLNMLIRLADIGDLSRINEIYNQAVLQRFCTAHLNPVDMEYRQLWFREHDPGRNPVYVACEGERVTGWVSLGPYRSGRQALVHVAEVSYYVDRQDRKMGVGTRLMEQARITAASCGYSVLIAILLSNNPGSLALLEKFGFSCWGTMPGIAKIDDQTADHLYYGLKL